MNDPGITELLNRLRNRFFGKYRGTVVDVDSGTLRVKAEVPAVLGSVPTGWCMPCVPYAGKGVGMAFLPEVGAGVWIEFEAGDVSYPIWSGCYWREGETPADAAPAVKVILTAGGSELKLDDNAGSITIFDSNGNSATFADSGITLSRGSNSVDISDSEVSVNDGALEVM
jgi:uncharacterized protein involved in type VI secretion and phage assembly